MRAWFIGALLTIVSAPALAADAPEATPEQAIRAGTKDLEAAWAKHDAKAVAALYANDAEIVTESGQTLSGRDGIEQALTDGFANTLQNSTLTESIEKVRLIKPDVAIVDAEAEIKTGEGDPNKVHLISVIVKQDGKWLIETTRAIAYKS